MKIAYINSICHRHDAISNAIHDEIIWLIEAGHEVRLFAYSCHFDDLPYTIVDDERGVAFHPFFQQCELSVFHYGVYYPLFNLLPVVPNDAVRIVIFHNVTPKEVLPESSHKLIDMSFAQMTNIAFADHVICDSKVNEVVLRAAGVSVPVTVLPLAVHSALSAPLGKPSFSDGVFRLAFVGRLVASKGPVDLLVAVRNLLEKNKVVHIKMDLIANLHFSNAEVANDVRAEIDRLIERFGPRLSASLLGNATDECKQEVLRNADVFVLPTRHEGFCVPVIEALASGCRVVTYDNSNLPAICGGHAMLVPTGDVAQLSNAIGAVLEKAAAPEWRQGTEYAQTVQSTEQHLQQFSVEKVRKRFLTFIRQHGHRYSTGNHA